MDTDNIRYHLRQTFETELVRAYLQYAPPTTWGNVLELPEKYLFPASPGYQDFCAAVDLEYREQRFPEAKTFYESACRLGHPLAQYAYGLWYLGGDRPDVAKDLKKAFQKFCASHKFGVGQAAYQLADFYRTGKGKIVSRDVKKAFEFLLEAVLDARVHWLFDSNPFMMLGMAYGLGRGPNQASLAETLRCFDRVIRYEYHKSAPVTESTPLGVVYQLAHIVYQYDTEEQRRQLVLRTQAIESHLDKLPPGRAMMSSSEYVAFAKTFGLDYDDYLAGMNGKKEGRRMTWKTFRRQTDGRAKLLSTYERLAEVDRYMTPLMPDDEDLRKHLYEYEVAEQMLRAVQQRQSYLMQEALGQEENLEENGTNSDSEYKDCVTSNDGAQDKHSITTGESKNDAFDAVSEAQCTAAETVTKEHAD